VDANRCIFTLNPNVPCPRYTGMRQRVPARARPVWLAIGAMAASFLMLAAMVIAFAVSAPTAGNILLALALLFGAAGFVSADIVTRDTVRTKQDKQPRT
jgi:L-serine deaminase